MTAIPFFYMDKFFDKTRQRAHRQPADYVAVYYCLCRIALPLPPFLFVVYIVADAATRENLPTFPV